MLTTRKHSSNVCNGVNHCKPAFYPATLVILACWLFCLANDYPTSSNQDFDSSKKCILRRQDCVNEPLEAWICTIYIMPM